ncbi:tRNA pseudouridine(55) synthase TruB [Agarilytica rhodophyticola]|uniref:tRNA pseudouridine(55) synthase TruB n=1 Tax=Agarilytica rhodophyticola TaxID=1737490 RepID=UPI000B341610|nr:tRNA pseudouridine(55) synthase TruB [Agarilytica rhodophyticola]
MARKRKFGRPIDGVILINKATGMTSNDVVQKVKRLFFASKAGHTGALDPLATGVLPICLGEATKFSQYLLDADKVYESTFCFGVATDTCDSDGQVIEQVDASALTQAQVEAALVQFRGNIEQVPPMYSALKKDGQPLYKLARAGIEVEREARKVTIHAFDILDFSAGAIAQAKVRIECTKGTYVRSLCDDLGRLLGFGAHVSSLKRVATGDFLLENAYSLAELTEERGEEKAEVLDHHLLATDAPVWRLPKITLDDDSGYYFGRGQAVMDKEVYHIGEEGDTVRVFRAAGDFLGLGEITDDGRVTPRRLVVR